MVEYSPLRVVERGSFPALLAHCPGLLFSPVLVCIEKLPSQQMHMLLGTATSIAAVGEEVPVLVSDQSESSRGDALVRSIADPPLLFAQESMHHLFHVQDSDCFASVGSCPEFDLPFL